VRCAGLDIGSRTVKLVILEDDRPVFAQVVLNSHDPLAVCRSLLSETSYDRLTATGYGRHLIVEHLGVPAITEIRAAALGARRLHPECRSVLDIGGQDTKVMRLSGSGVVEKFEMNDKCAAGTGRFLEIMAAALGWPADEFHRQAGAVAESCPVSAMCTVFAESEVVSALARGADRAQLARGVHEAVAGRAISLFRRVEARGPVLFCGGVAYNDFLARLLAERLNLSVLVPEHPQTVAALGAALETQRLAFAISGRADSRSS
jgi:(R)-2-hydroxyacyl-CoA dehydratese activating ATPase